MRIGIDIDGTLTDISGILNNAAYEYAIKIGKNVTLYNKEITSYEFLYKKYYSFSDVELDYFIKNIQEKIIEDVLPRKNAKLIIDKLKKCGDEIYIITSRSYKYHNDPFKISESWLNENEIKYDKLIVNADDKVLICKKFGIELFVDDILDNCIKLSKNNIKAINIGSIDPKIEDVIYVTNWDQIYSEINKFKN